MPFDPDNPPEKVRHLPKKKQRQFCEVFNKAWKDGKGEAKSHQIAWGVVKKSAARELLSIAERIIS